MVLSRPLFCGVFNFLLFVIQGKDGGGMRLCSCSSCELVCGNLDIYIEISSLETGYCAPCE